MFKGTRKKSKCSMGLELIPLLVSQRDIEQVKRERKKKSDGTGTEEMQKSKNEESGKYFSLFFYKKMVVNTQREKKETAEETRGERQESRETLVMQLLR